jgi:hypothetical protein
MATTPVDFDQRPSNPLDLLEELVAANEWPFDRAGPDEMVVETAGRWCDYRMYFVWREQASALYFTCAFDCRVPETKRADVMALLALVNEKLWLGHFDVSSEDGLPMFRYTLLSRGWQHLSVEQLEDLVDIALCECDRFYPAFQFVVWAGRAPCDAVSMAIMETAGEA